MRKLLLLATSAAVLAAVSQPGFAASRTHRADPPAAADKVQQDYYSYYGSPGYNAFGQGEVRSFRADPTPAYPTEVYPTYPSQNLPYPDRPYGDPDKW